jgi:hypothetical protein
LRGNAAALRQIFKMCEHRITRGPHEARIKPDVDRRDQRRNIGFTLGELMQDRLLAAATVANVMGAEAVRIHDHPAMARKIDRLGPANELFKRCHVVAHGAVRRRHDRRRPRHHVVAGEQHAGSQQRKSQVVRGMAGGRYSLYSPTGAVDNVAIGQQNVGIEIDIAACLITRDVPGA